MANVNYKTAVKRGAKLLDEKEPGWRALVDVDELDMSSACNCVVGQVFSGVAYFKAIIELECWDTVACGFQVNHLADWDKLQAEWAKELT
jgi:hypothetical protein